MQDILKQFGAKATASFSERFNRSLIRLTVLYSLTLALILTISGFVLYSAFSRRIVHRFRGVAPIVITIDRPIIAPSTVMPTPEQLREDLIESLLFVNISLLALAIILSYWLAKKTLEPIKRSYEEQERFLGDVSHELRTPIAILQMDLENELLTHPAHAEAIESRLEEVRRMGKMVNDIVSISRMNHATTTLSRQSVVLVPLVEATIKRLQPLAEREGVTMQLAVEGAQVRYSVDEALFDTAITNIIKNAILYNRPDGTVAITLRQAPREIVLEVLDSGIGIDPDDLKHVFNRFYRADKSRTRQSDGTGLGLSIAQSAVERMGGTIAIESERDVGTKITMRFFR